MNPRFRKNENGGSSFYSTCLFVLTLFITRLRYGWLPIGKSARNNRTATAVMSSLATPP